MTRNPKRISEKYLYNSSLSYLKKFPTTVHNLKRRLLKQIQDSCNEYPDQEMQECLTIAGQVIKKLCQLGLLDDALYLEGSVRTLRKKGHSAKAIQFKLLQKGLPKEKVAEELAKSSDLSAAMTYLKKKSMQGRDPLQQLQCLARNGFNMETAKAAIQNCQKEC